MLPRLLCLTLVSSFFALGSPQLTAFNYENLNAVLWMQTSVEYRVSTIQTYRAGEAALRRALKNPHWTAAVEQSGNFENLPPAVILDLDETVLDNSRFRVRLLGSNPDDLFPNKLWNDWVVEQRAGLVPGAIEFLQFAHANGVVPLYITNRSCDPTKPDDPTVGVLARLHLPVDGIADHLLCQQPGSSSDKTERRRACAEKYRILLLFGDQLGDFVGIPATSANPQGREKLFAAYQNYWGERWFQLPNPSYGSWRDALGAKSAERLAKLEK